MYADMVINGKIPGKDFWTLPIYQVIFSYQLSVLLEIHASLISDLQTKGIE